MARPTARTVGPYLELVDGGQVTSLAITKLDGTAKGGVVIGISDQFRIPVRYIGIGEGIDAKSDNINLFHGRTER